MLCKLLNSVCPKANLKTKTNATASQLNLDSDRPTTCRLAQRGWEAATPAHTQTHLPPGLWWLAAPPYYSPCWRLGVARPPASSSPGWRHGELNQGVETVQRRRLQGRWADTINSSCQSPGTHSNTPSTWRSVSGLVASPKHDAD